MWSIGMCGLGRIETGGGERCGGDVSFNHVDERSEWYDMDTNGFVLRLRGEGLTHGVEEGGG